MSERKQNMPVPSTSSEQINQTTISGSEKRPSLVDLLNTHHINISQLAKKSGVSPVILRQMMMDQPVSEEDIYKVLTTFNLYYSTGYTIQSTNFAFLVTQTSEKEE